MVNIYRSTSQLRQRSAAVQVSKLTSLSEARALAPEWAALAEMAGGRSPFAHPEWLMPWAERFIRRQEEIWLFAARQRGRLVGVAPYYRRLRGPAQARSMQLWGTGRHSRLVEFPQLLIHPEQPRPIARALVTQICAENAAWDWAEVSLGDRLWLEPQWVPGGGKVTILMKGVRASVVLPIIHGKQPIAKRNIREALRQARNRLDRSYPEGWSVTCASSSADLLDALSDLARLHADRSGVLGKEHHPNAISSGEDRSFLSAAVLALSERGGAAIYRLIVHDNAVAALLVLRNKDCTYFLLSGLNRQFWQFSPVTVLQGRAVEDAVASAHRWVNLSTGPDTAKLRWSEELAVSPEFLLVPNRARSRIVFGIYWQASAAATLARERERHRLLFHEPALARTIHGIGRYLATRS